MTPGAERRLLTAIENGCAPGPLCRPPRSSALDNPVGSGDLWQAVSALADQGRLATLATGGAVYLRWLKGDGAMDPKATDALLAARKGVSLLNGEGFDSHARAMAAFEKASPLMRQAAGDVRARGVNQAQIETLRANAALEMLRDTVADAEQQLTTRADAERVRTTMEKVRLVKNWLSNAMTDGRTGVPKPDEAVYAALKTVSDVVGAERHEVKLHGSEIAAGIKGMKAFVEFLGPMNSGKSSPTPAAAPQKLLAAAGVGERARRDAELGQVRLRPDRQGQGRQALPDGGPEGRAAPDGEDADAGREEQPGGHRR